MKEKLYETSWLQLASVVRFAEALDWHFSGRSFYSYFDHLGKSKCVYVDFDSMQKVHNSPQNMLIPKATGIVGWNYKDPTFWDNRIVHKSTLQYHKKLKRFIAQKDRVRFV